MTTTETHDVEALQAAVRAGERPTFLFFWGTPARAVTRSAKSA